jgi:hypothetical protein
MALREDARAAQAADGAAGYSTPEPPPEDSGVYRNSAPVMNLPEIDYTNSGLPVTPSDAPVQIAWAAVMAEVQQVNKGGRFSAPGAGTYNFRGIDQVLNAVGPALRKHRVAVIPVKVAPHYRDVTVGAKQTAMRECTITVDYMIYGPRGDSMTAASAGECLDSGDKGTTKAQTVAFRNLLINGLAIPTDNPNLDADQVNYQRSGTAAVEAMPTPQELASEALEPATSVTRLRAIYDMVRPGGTYPNFGQATVTDGTGDPIKLADLIKQLGKERAGS